MNSPHPSGPTSCSSGFQSGGSNVLSAMVCLVPAVCARLRASHCRPNHVTGATGPADVLARVLDRDRKVVPTTVVALGGAGWALGHMVPANLAELRSDVIQDPEFRPSRAPLKLRFNLGFCRRKLRWNRFSGNQPGKLFTCHLGKTIEVAHLLLEVVISAVEPEAFCGTPVNTQRTADGIPVFTGLQLVVLREDLDPFPQPTSLDRHPQPQGKVVHVN